MYKPPLLKDLLAAKQAVLLDGAWGTMLAEHAPAFVSHPARAVLEAPDAVASLAASYCQSGAAAITTSTFRASPWLMQRTGLDWLQLNADAVRLARPVAQVAVLGSIAPIRAETSQGDDAWLREQFTLQAVALLQAGCRTAWLETFRDVPEALLAIQACREVGFEEVCCSLYQTAVEVSQDKFVALVEGGADCVGLNCTNGPAVTMALLDRLDVPSLGCPFAVRPNAGSQRSMPATPELFATLVPELLARGVSLLGGCCGTSPAHIAAMRERLQQELRG